MGGKLFHQDGQTDKTKLIIAFCNFANAPKKGRYSVISQVSGEGYRRP
jgi:hypothetical protein